MAELMARDAASKAESKLSPVRKCLWECPALRVSLFGQESAKKAQCHEADRSYQGDLQWCAGAVHFQQAMTVVFSGALILFRHLMVPPDTPYIRDTLEFDQVIRQFVWISGFARKVSVQMATDCVHCFDEAFTDLPVFDACSEFTHQLVPGALGNA